MSVNQLSDTQIAGYAAQAGFTGNQRVQAVAIALAESGGIGNARHLNTNGTVDTGLWQINSVHSQYNTTLLATDYLYNARAAYQLSSGGRNWGPWTTYNTGAYRAFLPRAQAATGTSTGSAGGSGAGPPSTTITLPTLNHRPWWQFPRIDNLGAKDPMGNFPKPDSNIQVPDGYPVEALLPGTVSGINRGVSYGCVVTIRLDKPLNSLANHTFYEHLRGDIQVRVGQHVTSGQLIAFNGGGQACGSEKVPLGFGLYNGDNYATDGAFALMTPANLNGGPLDPVPLLNQAKTGKLNLPGYVPGTGFLTPVATLLPTFGPPKTYTPLLEQVHETLINTPGFYGIALSLDEAEKFPGFIDLTQSEQVDIPIGALGIDVGDVTLPIPDVAGGARSVGATITDNFVPFAIRSGLVLFGSFLFVMLFMKAISGPVMEALPYLMEAAA